MWEAKGLAERQTLWTPDGMHTIGAKAAERFELKPGIMRWLEQFADVAQFLKLGVYCSLCKCDMIGKNSPNDSRFTVTCGCRELVAENRNAPKVVPH